MNLFIGEVNSYREIKNFAKEYINQHQEELPSNFRCIFERQCLIDNEPIGDRLITAEEYEHFKKTNRIKHIYKIYLRD